MTFEETVKELYPDKYNKKAVKWLKYRYGNNTAEQIWKKTKDRFMEYYAEAPDYGGSKNGHSMAIYGGMLFFALYESLPDEPDAEELERFAQDMFMEPFKKLGKVFDLNSKTAMWLIDKIFRRSGNRDRKDIIRYPDGFINVDIPYDSEHQVARYKFTQCPNAEFAKKHGLLHVLPFCCNCDFYGIEQIHGQLIRTGTCGNSEECDYCVVGSRNPLARQYEIVKDDRGFLVSRKKEKEYDTEI